MQAYTLKRANELNKLMVTTDHSLTQLYKLKAMLTSRKERDTDERFDGLFDFVICETSKASKDTYCAELRRKEGNAELLDVIIDTLTEQLRNYTAEFSKL